MDPNRSFGARRAGDNLNVRRFPQFRGVGRRLDDDDAPSNPIGLDPAQNGVLARRRQIIAFNELDNGPSHLDVPVQNNEQNIQNNVHVRMQMPQVARRGRRNNMPVRRRRNPQIPPVLVQANQELVRAQASLQTIRQQQQYQNLRRDQLSRRIVNVPRVVPSPPKRAAIAESPMDDVSEAEPNV